jgi:hypothetical protein
MKRILVFMSALALVGLSACNLIEDLMPKKPGGNTRPSPVEPAPQPKPCGMEGTLVKMCGRGVFGQLWIKEHMSGTLLHPVRMDSNIVLPAVVLEEGTVVRFDAERIEKSRCERGAEGYKAFISCFGIVSYPKKDSVRTQTTTGKLVKKCGDSAIGGTLWIASIINNDKELLQPLKSEHQSRVRFQEGDEVKVEFLRIGRPNCDPKAKASAIAVLRIEKI